MFSWAVNRAMEDDDFFKFNFVEYAIFFIQMVLLFHVLQIQRVYSLMICL